MTRSLKARLVSFLIVFFSRGINLLDKRSELEKAMAKHKQATNQKLKKEEKLEDDGAFKKMLAERANRLAKVGDQEP